MKRRSSTTAGTIHLTDLCICGHDFGSHLQDGGKKRCAQKTGPELTCACLGFRKRIRPDEAVAHAPSFADRAAGDVFIRERASRLERLGLLSSDKNPAGPTGSTGPHTKGDSLLLLRIATALERIADALDEANIPPAFRKGAAR